MTLERKRIVVGVSAGIAAYKAVELCRELLQRGADVRVAMTKQATRFVGPLTFGAITGTPAITDLWDPGNPGEVHVELGAWAELVIVVPATQNTLARAAAGFADDVLLAMLSCVSCPVLYAPAMHERMWLSAANQRNVTRLEATGARMIGPVRGPLASGQIGIGRLEEPSAIADAAQAALRSQRDFVGRTVLVSAGPTVEDLDPVRYLTNRSTGRMGFALASVARDRGARVILVAGPTQAQPPSGVERIDVRSAIEMQQAIDAVLDRADVVIMTAAVADYRPRISAPQKIKKTEGRLTLELVRNPDILAALGAKRRGKRPVLIGFAMETTDLIENAKKKLRDKRVDLVVANEAAVGFGRDDTQAALVSHASTQMLAPSSKLKLAERILDGARALLDASGKPARKPPRKSARTTTSRSRSARRPRAPRSAAARTGRARSKA